MRLGANDILVRWKSTLMNQGTRAPKLKRAGALVPNDREPAVQSSQESVSHFGGQWLSVSGPSRTHELTW